MDPLTALIIAMWVASRFTKNVYQDSVFKARGEDPPSFRREMARWEAKQARAAGRSADTPGRRFFANAWRDAVESADERRARASKKAAERRREKWTEADKAKAEDEAHAINERLVDEPPAKEAPTPESMRCDRCGKDTPTKDMKLRVPLRLEIIQRVCPRCSADIDRDDSEFRNLNPDWGRIDDSEPTSPDRGERMVQCAECGNDVRATDTSWINVDGATLAVCPPCRLNRAEPKQEFPEPPECPPTAYDGTLEPAPAPTGQGAEVIQFADWQRSAPSPTTEVQPLTAEITGLRSAIQFCEQAAAAADQNVTQTEMANAGLQSGGTHGAAVTHALTGMEALTDAAAHYRNAAQIFRSHLNITESYEANNGAGSREFVTNS